MTRIDETLAQLRAFVRRSRALGEVAGRLHWDQEAVMPEGAAPQRAEESAAMEAVLHARRTDPRLGEWLAELEGAEADLDPVARREVVLIGREYRRATRVPARLAEEIARQTSLAHGIWAEARANEESKLFLPVLRRIVALRREEAQAVADGGDPYDALLDDYEPGATGAWLAGLFDALRPGLLSLRERILGRADAPAGLEGFFARDEQLALARELARRFGYDWMHGRLDLAVHPFSSGSGLDVRITTRVDEGDPFNCIYSTIHEVGHAVYEQRIDRAYLLGPIGRGASMGVHESQSRSFENQMGRSPAFAGWLFTRMRELFGDLGVGDADAFVRAVNRVVPGYIRTEADEVHYNLHVMLRFDLERALIRGELEVEDLEEAWNSRFRADFGVEVDRPSHGFLQDVHWAAGLFGYFPTYTLGNIYAGCLWQPLRADIPELERELAAGNPAPAVDWLSERVHRFGSLKDPQDVIRDATGAEPDVVPLLAYLEEKFGGLYGL